MLTRTFGSALVIPIHYLVLPLLLFISLAGCFTAPSPNLDKLKCTTDQQCPAGYSCLAPNQVGGCCKPGTPCPITAAMDASNPDYSPADLQLVSEVQPMGIDLGTGGGGGRIAPDGPAAGGAGGGIEAGSVAAADGSLDAAVVGGTGGSVDAGAATGSGGVLGTGGVGAVGGGAGGVGGAPDAGPHDLGSDATDVSIVSPPVISSFSASPASITAGASANLNWVVTGAATLSIDQGVGMVTGTASKVVTPTQTTTYTLTASNASGTPVTAQTSVVVVVAPVISSFSATPATITSGKSTTLSWSVSGASTVSIDQSIGVVTGTSQVVTPGQSTTYTLSVQNSLGASVTKQVQVTVVAAPQIANLTAAANPISPGGSTTLTPVFTGGTGTISKPTGNVGAASGVSVSTGTLSTTTTFTLTVTNSAGDSVTRQITVSVAGFIATGSMSAARSHHTATLLQDGKVLVAGGEGVGTRLNTAELYDPSTGLFSLLPNTMTTDRSNHTATLLPSGKVLLAGGGSSTSDLDSAELYDPSARTFTLIPSTMSMQRPWSTAVLLSSVSGKVLIACDAASSTAADIYDPSQGTMGLFYSSTLVSAQADATMTLLTSGWVLIAAGHDTPATGAELFLGNTFRATTGSAMAVLPTGGHTATLLPSGKVLIAGGGTMGGVVDQAQLYDPSSEGFTATGSLNASRFYHTAAALSNGDVLIAGGSDSTAIAEVYGVASGSFTPTNPMVANRRYHTATALSDGTGRVLIVGGVTPAGTAPMASAELYVR